MKRTLAAATTERFKKGDSVSLAVGEPESWGTVCRATKDFAYVEWVGFPPNAPTDGHFRHSQLRLRIDSTAKRREGQPQ